MTQMVEMWRGECVRCGRQLLGARRNYCGTCSPVTTAMTPAQMSRSIRNAEPKEPIMCEHARLIG